MISKIDNNLYNIRNSQNIPYEGREYHLESKEFDYPEPEIELTPFDNRIPSPFIRK